jgi:calcineurin-like phosphoesterase family protein
MKESAKAASDKSGLAEAYFRYLETPVRGVDGIMRQPAATNFVAAGLRETYALGNGRRGLATRLRDAMAAGRLYVWSDQHLGHKALEKLRGRSAGETDAVMLSNALATVGEKDVLIFGGDISMTDISTTNAWLRQIPATRILVLGNHDFDKHATAQLKLAVDDVVSCLELPGLFVTHYPVPERVLDAMRPGEGVVNLHGHMHGRELDAEFGSGARHVDMSVECIDFAPVLIKLPACKIDLLVRNK